MEIEKLKYQPGEGLHLYRYVTMDKLMDCLLNKRIPFTRLNLFEDKLEGMTPGHIILNLKSEEFEEMALSNPPSSLVTNNINPTERNFRRRQRVAFQKHNYASCWFASDHESIAMWHLYSRPDSIAIRIPIEAFMNEINSEKFELSECDHIKIRYGSVQYYRFDNLNAHHQLETDEEIQGFAKDKSYCHESEFRLILSTRLREQKIEQRQEFVLDEQVEELNQDSDLKVIYLKFAEFQNLPFEIVLHPQSSDWHKSNIKETIKKYKLQFSITESKLTRMFK